MSNERHGILNSWRIAFAVSSILAALAVIFSIYLYTEVRNEADARTDAVRAAVVQNCNIVIRPIEDAITTAITIQLFVLLDAFRAQNDVSGRVEVLARRDKRLLRQLQSLPPCKQRYPPL